jgi:hypothetical protein
MLRQAQPLYSECHSILNGLDDSSGVALLPVPQSPAVSPKEASDDQDADFSILLSELEPLVPNGNSIM